MIPHIVPCIKFVSFWVQIYPHYYDNKMSISENYGKKTLAVEFDWYSMPKLQSNVSGGVSTHVNISIL